jgi:hypothetical protein
MDNKNLFATPATFTALRLEYLAALIALVVLMWHQATEVRWGVALGLFAYIDVIGYLPGAIAARRRGHGYIPKAYYVLYNVMHSLLTAGLVVGMWWIVVGPEWALLAIPIHLFADRSINGNFMKPFGVSFEPQAHPVYYSVKPLLDGVRQPDWTVPGRGSSDGMGTSELSTLMGSGAAWRP